MPAALKIKAGDKFGKYTIVAEVDRYISPKGSTSRCFLVQCDCGSNPREALLHNLRKIPDISCGCDKGTHRLSKTPQYKRWQAMLQRCTNPKHPQWKDYGGRGITVCDEWFVFEKFWNDMDEDYDPTLTLERNDVDKGYNKENCVWADMSKQGHNRRKMDGTLSCFKGVKVKGNGIYADISYKGMFIYLGAYSTQEDAANAYDCASEILYGDRQNGTVKDSLIFEQICVRLRHKLEIERKLKC